MIVNDENQQATSPSTNTFVAITNDLFEVFPKIVEYAFGEQQCGPKGKRSLDVLAKRYGLGEQKKYTLEEIGLFLGVTRQRVQQIEKSSIEYIREIIMNQNKCTKWRLPVKLLEAFEQFNTYISSVGWLATKCEIESYANNADLTLPEPAYTDLLMETLAFKKGVSSVSGFRGELHLFWYKNDAKEKMKVLEPALKILDSIFDDAGEVSVFDAVVMVRKKTGPILDRNDINVLLKVVKDFTVREGSISASFSSLRSAADKAYRILSLNRKPMHFTDILREMNRLQSKHVYKEENVKNQLVGDSRFRAIGRSGLWGLSVWENISTLTITETIESVLHSSGSPLGLDEIIALVNEKRPDAAKRSIITYLNTDDRFCKVQNGFALSNWRIEPSKKRVRKSYPQQDFNKVLLEDLAHTSQTPLSEITSQMQFKTGLSEAGVRQKIHKAQNQGICKISGASKKLVAPLKTDSPIEEKIQKREIIQQEILSILSDHPNEPITKNDLYKEVNKNYPCKRPTYYRYLSEMKNLKSYKRGNEFFVLYEHIEYAENIIIDIEAYTDDKGIAKMFVRPLSMLSYENIDLALYELGVIFEVSIKEYLTELKQSGTLPVPSKTFKTLNNMILFVEENEIVKKGYYLNVLRDERNERSHERIETELERKNLFNKGEYISKLYVKYISFFEKERRTLKTMQTKSTQ